MRAAESAVDAERFRNWAVLAICLFLMPAAAWFTGTYVMANLGAASGKMTGASAHAALGQADTVRQLAAWTAAIGSLVPALIIGARRYAGTDRARMALVFGPVVQFVLLLLALSTLAQACLFVFSAYAIEMQILRGVHVGVLVAAAAGALTTCYALVRSAVSAMTIEPLVVQAEALNRVDHPAVFLLIEATAQKLGADAPDNVIVGLDPTFFVTTSDVVLLADGVPPIQGRTLFLSLSLMSAFTVEELRSVIGHELGHFLGDDLAYSLKFAPLYARLRRTTLELGESAGLAATLGRIPASAALSTCLLEFASAQRTEDRERELLADQCAVRVTDARAGAIALLKSALLAPRWDELMLQHLDMIQQGQVLPRLSEAYALRCEAFLETADLPAALMGLAASVQLHPVDTHPPLQLRLERLRMRLQDIEPADLKLAAPSAWSLIDDASGLDERLSELRRRSISAGLAATSSASS
jgi:Zn-dependent protease with chaperone function